MRHFFPIVATVNTHRKAGIMNYLKKAAAAAMASICLLSSYALAGEYFTDMGSMWLGGGLGFFQYHVRDNSDASNSFVFSPIFRIFPCKYLVVGPALTFTTSGQKGYSSSSISIGPEIGFAYGNNIPVIPYILSSFRYVHYSSTSDQIYTYGQEGYEIPIASGLMIPVADGLGLQAEMGYRYQHLTNYRSNNDLGTFYIAVGVCGIGKRFALSIMDLIMD
jgi:hypothetical protein